MSKFKALEIKIGSSFPGLVTLKRRVEVLGKPKIFCIGRNKTGTTSITQAFMDLGFRVGIEKEARNLIHFYAKRDFKPIIRFCKTAQVFEDFPFSFPYTFQVVDQAFPKSKFILTVRNNADQWYRSVINHAERRVGETETLPTKEELKRLYVNSSNYKISRWDFMNLAREINEDDLYSEKILKAHYNNTVFDYFRHRKDDILVLNLEDPNSYLKFCSFINRDPLYDKFPHKNASI